MLDLYHRTNAEAAARLVELGVMLSKYPDGSLWFSTVPHGQNEGYGSVIVHVRVPEEIAVLDDEFSDGEEHYVVLAKDFAAHGQVVGIMRNEGDI